MSANSAIVNQPHRMFQHSNRVLDSEFRLPTVAEFSMSVGIRQGFKGLSVASTAYKKQIQKRDEFSIFVENWPLKNRT